MTRVTVVGAGVVGLTCAVNLAEAGFTVDVLARDLPLETSSAAGTGLWWPSALEPADAAARWERTTLRALRELSRQPDTGVTLRPGHVLGGHTGQWPASLGDARDQNQNQDDSADDADGSRAAKGAHGANCGDVTVPVVDMDRYLPYLVRRLTAADGTLTRMALAALPSRGTVVNCTGVAARALAADPAVRPSRAQVLRLADPGLDAWWVDADPGSPCTVVPHGRHVTVGGPVEDGDWSSTPDPAAAERLRERAVRLVPALDGAPVLGHRVGLRSTRPAVRLQACRERDRMILHCYGHGAAGHAVAWGCADDVTGAVGSSE